MWPQILPTGLKENKEREREREEMERLERGRRCRTDRSDLLHSRHLTDHSTSLQSIHFCLSLSLFIEIILQFIVSVYYCIMLTQERKSQLRLALFRQDANKSHKNRKQYKSDPLNQRQLYRIHVKWSKQFVQLDIFRYLYIHTYTCSKLSIFNCKFNCNWPLMAQPLAFHRIMVQIAKIAR